MLDQARQISEKIDRIISLLEAIVIQNERPPYADEDAEYHPEPPVLAPVVPVFTTPPIQVSESVCPDCGVQFKGGMGYVCQKIGCPMGVGLATF